MKDFNLNNQNILITGGSGSWGQELISQLLKKYRPKEIRIFSRGEEKQVHVKRKFQDSHLKFIIGDVRDLDRLKNACRNIDVIFHLAALKHVPVVEENPWEAVLTNIIGTQNVIEAATYNNVKKVIYVSSDKACDPFNLYGVTKAVGEKLIIAANNLDCKTVFACIRAGNVLGTSGSVVPLFKEQLKKANKITITDQKMNRYFMSLRDAIGLVLKATKRSLGGEIFVTKMFGIKIMVLAQAMVKKLGNQHTKIEMIGIRPGEKIYENLVSENESTRTYEEGEYYIILPMIQIPKLKLKYENRYKKMNKVKFAKYTSENAPQLDETEIIEILKKEMLFEDRIEDESSKYLQALEKKSLLNFAKSEGWLNEK